MPRSRRARFDPARFDELTTPVPSPRAPAEPGGPAGRAVLDLGEVWSLPLDQIMLELAYQPRWVARATALIAEIDAAAAATTERAEAAPGSPVPTPATLLAALQRLRPEPAWARTWEGLEALARSVRAQGVLEPVAVVRRERSWVLREGHRRCLAALLAGLEAVPARAIPDAPPIETLAQALVRNQAREELSPVEIGIAVRRLASEIGEAILRGEREPAYATPSPRLQRLLAEARAAGGALAARPAASRSDEAGGAEAAEEGSGGDPGQPLLGEGRWPRGLQELVVAEVCGLTGDSRTQVYRYLQFGRLSPAAQALAADLDEHVVEPVLQLPPELQVAALRQIAAQRLTVKEARAFVRNVDRRPTMPTARALGSLLSVPNNYTALPLHLRAMLAAARNPAARARLLDHLREQRRRLADCVSYYDSVLAAADGLAGATTDKQPAATGE